MHDASETMTAKPTATGQRQLRRDLHRPQVLAIVVGSVVGTGIYIRPASIAQFLGSPALIIGVWIVGGFLALCGALIYGQLSILVPGTGGEYLFLRTTLGRMPAFLYGWMRLTVAPAVVAGMAAAFTVFLGDSISLGGPWIHVSLPWGHRRDFIDVGPRQAIAIAVILGLAWLNTRGVGRAGTFQVVVTICKVVGLLLMLAAIAMFGHWSLGQATLTPSHPDRSALGYGGALLAVMATYNGWANAAIIGGEVRDAERTLPWAVVTGIVIVTALYLATNLAFLHTLSLEDIVTSNSTNYPNAPSVASRVVTHSVGIGAGTVLPLLFALSALGTAHCNILVMPRIFLSMARDGVLPAILASVSVSSATPNRAIWTFSGIAIGFALIGSYDRLTNMTTFAYLVFFALTTTGFLINSRTTPSAARNRAFWTMAMVACLFLLGTTSLIVASIARGSVEVLTAAALIGTGIPIFAAAERLRAWRSNRVNISVRSGPVGIEQKCTDDSCF